MSFIKNSLFKNRLSQIFSYFSTFLKMKFLKIAIKFGVLLAAIWLVSGNWLGDKLITLLKSSSGGIYTGLHNVALSLKGLAVASLIIILAKVIIGRPISKILFALVGIGLVVLFLERFIF
ncbi:MAG: hypothetical protein K2W94_05260 [Alphaproteobacteria bacterium]|nr:hypothetical protein [Alphaproteobacteria bacterium]